MRDPADAGKGRNSRKSRGKEINSEEKTDEPIRTPMKALVLGKAITVPVRLEVMTQSRHRQHGVENTIGKWCNDEEIALTLVVEDQEADEARETMKGELEKGTELTGPEDTSCMAISIAIG